jgi:hypothetical protein
MQQCAALFGRRELPADRRSHPFLSVGDDESRNRQHPRMRPGTPDGWPCSLVEFGKDALLAAVLLFQLGSFGRVSSQLDIKLRI